MTKMKRANLQEAKARGADLENIETLKQIAINCYTENGLTIQKIRDARRGDGFYVYQKYARERNYIKRVIVEEGDTFVKFYRQKKTVSTDWFPTNEGLETFEDYANRNVAEALSRKGV